MKESERKMAKPFSSMPEWAQAAVRAANNANSVTGALLVRGDGGFLTVIDGVITFAGERIIPECQDKIEYPPSIDLSDLPKWATGLLQDYDPTFNFKVTRPEGTLVIERGVGYFNGLVVVGRNIPQ